MSDRRLLMTYRSPFARKVRVVLREKGLSHEEVNVDLEHKTPELLKTGPIQKIPVLFDAGLTIVDSNVICEYLEERYPAIRLFPHGPLYRADARMWNQTANELAEAAIKVFMDARKPASLQDRAGVLKAQKLVDRVLDYAETIVARRDFLVAHEFTIADVSLVCAASYVDFRLGNAWRAKRPALTKYVDGLLKQKSFAETMPRI